MADNDLRALTDKEHAALTATSRLAHAFGRMPVVHPADAGEFVHHLHAIQNMIHARPSVEQAMRERLIELGVEQ